MRSGLLVLVTCSMLACKPAVELPTRSDDEIRAVIDEYCWGTGICHWPEELRDEEAFSMCMDIELKNVLGHPIPRCVESMLDWYECMNDIAMCTEDIGEPGGPCSELTDIWHDDECFCATHEC